MSKYQPQRGNDAGRWMWMALATMMGAIMMSPSVVAASSPGQAGKLEGEALRRCVQMDLDVTDLAWKLAPVKRNMTEAEKSLAAAAEELDREEAQVRRDNSDANIERYNRVLATHNRLVEEYNATLPAYRAVLEPHNAAVDTFNDTCLEPAVDDGEWKRVKKEEAQKRLNAK